MLNLVNEMTSNQIVTISTNENARKEQIAWAVSAHSEQGSD